MISSVNNTLCPLNILVPPNIFDKSMPVHMHTLRIILDMKSHLNGLPSLHVRFRFTYSTAGVWNGLNKLEKK